MVSETAITPQFSTFKSRAEAANAEVHHFCTRADALTFILEFLRGEGVHDAPDFRAVWADCPFLDELNKDELDKKKLSASVPGLVFDITREACAEARIGISQMDWGKADTGTLVQDATRVEKRLVSTLPLIHIALIATDNIFPDLPSLLTRIDPREAGYIAFITGPSRTADIERVLTIGVHGPQRLIIVAVDEMGGNG
jgi:L-lactate dehydrogenase complex protein LldG